MAKRSYSPKRRALKRRHLFPARLDHATIDRLYQFVEKVQAHYQPTVSKDAIIAQLLTEALDARLFFAHPGSGRGKDDNLTGF